MRTIKKWIVKLIIVLSFLFFIISIIVAMVRPYDCNLSDIDTGSISPRGFLLVSGTFNCIQGFLCSLYLFSTQIVNSNSNFYKVILFAICLFDIVWKIIGGFILFRSNIECINKFSVPVIGAIIAWVFTFWIICCFACTKEGKKKEEGNIEEKIGINLQLP